MKKIQKQNKARNYGGQYAQRIDINVIHNQLQQALSERNKAQAQHDNAWDMIKNGYNGRSRLNEADRLIGNNTHKLNQLIGQLSKYRKTHRAMNLANKYLNIEIERNRRIIQSQRRLIKDVNAGYKSLIDSKGITHTDPTSLINYVARKENQLKRLQKWQDTIKLYVVR